LKKIYVGNLSFDSNDRDLAAVFAAYGDVASAKVVIDRDTDRSRGFGFVEMSDDNAALKAIEALNGKDVGGRALNVNEARPREPRTGGSKW
jgi:RNA recognition motif-containing protein